jgi:predicted DNA-binding transcriptional regulator AlpA
MVQLQRAIRRQDVIPQKRVAYEVGVSQTTLWRALKSDLPNFPAPVVIRKKVYWRKADLPALEDALMSFQVAACLNGSKRKQRGECRPRALSIRYGL